MNRIDGKFDFDESDSNRENREYLQDSSGIDFNNPDVLRELFEQKRNALNYLISGILGADFLKSRPDVALTFSMYLAFDNYSADDLNIGLYLIKLTNFELDPIKALHSYVDFRTLRYNAVQLSLIGKTIRQIVFARPQDPVFDKSFLDNVIRETCGSPE